ncbi:PIN domain-containing protein [Ancylobacter polymorphus]|uniref:PIN domain-containing protein n=1 Tax=Ancylobacter polymorphus TaxID=223390 RepID=A0A9E7A3D8_9HYPH|nr:PIN domain-containing protein [Ancylobacter polymorphus]UOK72460.1 PIN domain-containing protein [Ancylobacter polymorphus]
MKSELFEFFRPTDTEFDNFWKEGIVVPDANVLLTLIRYNRKSSDDLFSLFEKIKYKIWIPHQVAYEFLNNCHSVFFSMEQAYIKLSSAYDEIRSISAKKIDQIKSEYRFHPSLDFEDGKSSLFEAIKDIENKIKSNQTINSKADDINSIIERVASLFENRIGRPYSDADYKEFCRQADIRYQMKMPPGYLDAEKSDGGYGDFIVWQQLIEYSKENKKDIIFVTEDMKEDWWFRIGGRSIGPRRELRREFFDKTGCQFYAYTLAHWLSLNKLKGSEIVSDDTIKRAQSHQKIDEDSAKSLRESRVILARKSRQLDAKYSELKEKLDSDRRKLNELTDFLKVGIRRFDRDAGEQNFESGFLDSLEMSRKAVLEDINVSLQSLKELELEREAVRLDMVRMWRRRMARDHGQTD